MAHQPAPAPAPVRRGGVSVTGTLAVLGTVVMLPLALTFLGVWLAGWHLGVVRTGSMEPALPTGSMIVASPITADEVEAGMIVEFVDPDDGDRIITHRVVEVQRDPGGSVQLVTKGDANREQDTAPVPAENVRAEVRWHITNLGSLMWALRWPRSLAFVLVPLVLVVGSALASRARGRSAPAVGEPVPCAACASAVDAADRYCRSCGVRRRRVPVPA